MNQLSKYLFLLFLFAGMLYGLESCTEVHRTAVRNYPLDTAFVFRNIIHLDGQYISSGDKNTMTLNLPHYWDDSLNARRIRRYGFFYKVENPPIFDTANFLHSNALMNGYLNSIGYYQGRITDSFYMDSSYMDKVKIPYADERGKVKKRKISTRQIRTTVVVDIQPNRPTIIDTMSYELADSMMQKIALANHDKSLIRNGTTRFASDNISAELDRLVTIYRNNGYFRLSKGNLVAEIDTLDASLLRMTLNPFEQALKLAEAAKNKRENPSVKMAVKLRPAADSLQILSFAEARKQFKIGKQYFFPETGLTEIPDSVMNHIGNFAHRYTSRSGNIVIYDNEGKFHPRPILEHFYLHADSLYNDAGFYRTANNLSQIGSWQQVDSRYRLRGDSVVDFYYFLTPAVKQNITLDLEASRNTGDFLSAVNFGTSATSLLGLALNTTYRNRNAWRRGIQSTTALSNGVELNLGKDNVTNNVLQTVQSSITQTYVFPRFITPFRIRDKTPDGIRSILSVNGAYQDRREYFRLKSLVANWGYEWRAGNKVWQYRPLNVELYSLDTLRLLDSSLIYNPYIRNSFNTGAVVSQQLNVTMTYPDKNNPNSINYLRLGIEESGSILGRIKGIGGKIYQYIRFEAEYRKQINFKGNSTQLAFRAKGGIGYNYNPNSKFGDNLPFYKQFIAGGPNSMRAWSLRQLGLGSSLVNDTSSTFRDRYGDMQLEANLEYRYPIFAIGSSVKINGAVFTDVGNIWNVRTDPNLPNSEFNLSRLGKDIAIGVGTGLRFDFDYFLIRLDMGFKLKDPARLENGGWLDIGNFTWRNKEFLKYNPISGQPVYRNNYAIQLGINLPF